MRNLIQTSNGILMRTDVSGLHSTLNLLNFKITQIADRKGLPPALKRELYRLAKLANDAVFASEEWRKDHELELLQEDERPAVPQTDSST